jgi:lipid-A-disaccharide synthase
MRIAMVAGEASGDQLGAALINALRRQRPDLQVRAVAGPKMRAAGCEVIADCDELAVMGLAEVLRHLPRLWRLRSRLVRELLAWQPAVFVGIDAPDFNLRLARPLKAAGLRTVQYVSPQVWAWRANRVRTMGASCDRVLCLLPFEPAFYTGHGLAAEFVGHPLADEIPLQVDRQAARRALGITTQQPVIALLPGSRRGEVARLGTPFKEAAARLAAAHPNWTLLAPMANVEVARLFAELPPAVPQLQLLRGQARVALQAADGALVASGTATLEALLCACPMAAAYRFNPLTVAMVRAFNLYKLPHFAMPNLLANSALVPELFQNAVTGKALADTLLALLADPVRLQSMRQGFNAIHQTLRVDGAARAAAAVLAVAG